MTIKQVKINSINSKMGLENVNKLIRAWEIQIGDVIEFEGKDFKVESMEQKVQDIVQQKDQDIDQQKEIQLKNEEGNISFELNEKVFLKFRPMKTFTTPANTLRKNGFVLLKGFPCKIVDMSCSK